jgi:hypothetical protein
VAGRTAIFPTFQSELDNLVVTLNQIKVNNREIIRLLLQHLRRDLTAGHTKNDYST